MKLQRTFFSLILIAWVLTFSTCDDEKEKEIYLEGEPIPGIEIVFPLGYYSPEPMMPKISPDGKKLLFIGPSELPEWKGLWVMDLATQQKTLLHPDGRNADWAPDSEWIAFNIGSEIFKMKIDGAGLTQLTFPIDVAVGGSVYTSSSFFPDWSIENKLAYYLSIDYRTNEDGTRIITETGEEIKKNIDLGQPEWQIDGENIIGIRGILANSIETQFSVYNVTDNNIDKVLIAVTNQSNQLPKVSSDGNRLSFSNGFGIYLMNFDGTNVKRIIPSHLYGDYRNENPKLYSARPSWFPDGQHIIYEHFKITRSDRTAFGRRVEGVIQFYNVDVNEALSISNLKEK